MSNQIQNHNDKKKYDLAERTATFAENIIVFIKSIPDTQINRTLISQIIRSASSIAANYEEVDGAESKKDFRHKIGICKKEAKETRLWLRLIAKTNPDNTDKCRLLWQEAQELVLIFSTIIKNSLTFRFYALSIHLTFVICHLKLKTLFLPTIYITGRDR